MQATQHDSAPEASLTRAQERSELREQKRERILQTAARLFAENGYRATSMDSIADELGVTKPFLYYHFENKHELLEQIAKRVMAQARSALNDALASEGEPAAVLAKCVAGYLEVARSYQAFLGLLFREAQSLSLSTQLALQQEQDLHVSRLSALLRRGAEEGAFRLQAPILAAGAILRLVSFTDVFAPCGVEGDEHLTVQHYVALALQMVGAG